MSDPWDVRDVCFFLGQSQFHQSFHKSFRTRQPAATKGLPTGAITTGGHSYWGRGKAMGNTALGNHSYRGQPLRTTGTGSHTNGATDAEPLSLAVPDFLQTSCLVVCSTNSPGSKDVKGLGFYI